MSWENGHKASCLLLWSLSQIIPVSGRNTWFLVFVVNVFKVGISLILNVKFSNVEQASMQFWGGRYKGSSRHIPFGEMGLKQGLPQEIIQTRLWEWIICNRSGHFLPYQRIESCLPELLFLLSREITPSQRNKDRRPIQSQSHPGLLDLIPIL